MDYSIEKFSNMSDSTMMDPSTTSPQVLFSWLIGFLSQVTQQTHHFSINALTFLVKLLEIELKNFSTRFGSIQEIGKLMVNQIKRIPNCPPNHLQFLLKIFIRFLAISLQASWGWFMENIN